RQFLRAESKWRRSKEGKEREYSASLTATIGLLVWESMSKWLASEDY
ncbi:hypothetical protein A2U01_0090911, partial [Trifolium medium]|nr:hypothetical protein [Trifolium medium]